MPVYFSNQPSLSGVRRTRYVEIFVVAIFCFVRIVLNRVFGCDAVVCCSLVSTALC